MSIMKLRRQSNVFVCFFFFAINILNSVHAAPLEYRKKILVLRLTS